MIRKTFIRRSAAGWCWGVVLAMFLTTMAAFGQAGRGSLIGTVADQAGAVIPGAQVTLLNQATGVVLHTVANGVGFYTFISLNPGVYQVSASQKSFVTVTEENVMVSLDAATQVNVTLRVGAETQNVTVMGGEALMETSNSTVGSLIPASAMDRMPLLYRNPDDVVQLSPGVTPVNGSPNSSDSMGSIQNISMGRPGIDVSADTFNGSILGALYYMIDGSPIGVPERVDAGIMPAMTFPEDAIQEVRVETQNTSVSYQSGTAGVISLVSKSGSNKFHGDAFGVFRPDALSANEYFNKNTELSTGQSNTPPDFHRYQEGGAISGPIKKDKIFFFGDYEDTQQQQFEGIDYFTVPTSAERTGDFSSMSFTTYDPTQPDNSDGTRQAFAGNKILNPNPIGLLFLSKYPKCNLPSPRRAILRRLTSQIIMACQAWTRTMHTGLTCAWIGPRVRSSVSSRVFRTPS